MAVPPFPSQDLAKLVLGYLAEEQLMTTYDEFLQASPYLDALENEYDRVLMTSLRTMLAEYRAVKIYVETCKPVVLRRMMFQCTNLLEIVKFLIENIDVSKIQYRDSTSSSAVKQSSRTANKFCDECDSFSFQNCHCNKISMDINQGATLLKKISVETTSLKDLPGHQSQIGNDKNKDKAPQTSSKDLSKRGSYCVESFDVEPLHYNNSGSTQLQGESKPFRKLENQKIEIMNTNQDLRPNNAGLSALEKRMSKAGTFQDFSTGICGADSGNISVPDSSTSENVQIIATKVSSNLQSITVGSSKAVAENVQTDYLTIDQNNVASVNSNDSHISKNTPITNKQIEHKITILSDVKVDTKGKRPKMPKVLKNATSTPLLQMQTIFINGIPAYRQDPTMQPSSNYTQDEIMNMPTIIVAPTSTGSTISTAPAAVPTTTLSESSKPLGTLVLDLPPIDSNSGIDQTDDSDIINQPPLGLVKTVDFQKKNPSVPKDNIITSPRKVNTQTPLQQPVLRKASSTPRRSTHVRVLDFATPRRILHEVISENGNDNKTEGAVEVILSRSPNLAGASLNVLDSTITPTASKENTKMNPSTTKKKRDWDADLRALVSSVTPVSEGEKLMQSKCKTKSSKTKNSTEKVSRKSDLKRGGRKSAKAVKSVNGAIVEIIDDDEPVKEDKIIKAAIKAKKVSEKNIKTSNVVAIDSVGHTIKPTINIISREDKNSMLPPESSHKKDKSAEGIHKKDVSTEDLTDTPEAERLSLQNVIGAKLNISDFLETPYKQALYDIQMETPRFLGPDIPGDPMSDIKIMNIPTPRFLNSPNHQATPSSYSSRPTDYSSGGSYYKPDDHDFIPSELLGYPSSTKKHPGEDHQVEENSLSEKSRPVRKCTKNVSYYAGKQKENEESEQNISSQKLKSTFLDKKGSKQKESSKEKSSEKIISKKTENVVRKRKTPIKKDKSFMKIKPRKCSPKCKRKSISTSSKLPTNKKMPSKEKATSDTPLTVSAAPTKSRRKSSTPRKLHCTKQFVSDSSSHDSPEMESKNKHEPTVETPSTAAQDSDTEVIALRWSDDCSQEPKSNVDASTETDDILKIQEFIATSKIETQGQLHLDLMHRGFDAETAKRIERDLLDAPEQKPLAQMDTGQITLESKDKSINIESKEQKNLESDCSNNLLIDTEEDEDVEEDIELSIHECYEGSNNYICIQYNDEEEPQTKEVQRLKDNKFSMEICIDDDVTVRLRATPLAILVDQNEDESYRETQLAVCSISNFDKLYTPLKDAVRAKCCEIFDSTLTSLDTPLKAHSPIRHLNAETTVTDIVLDVEKVDVVIESVSVEAAEKIELKQKGELKEKSESKKRKRAQSGTSTDESTNGNKKAKPETQYLLNSANIQNIDIESVLKQLHGS